MMDGERQYSNDCCINCGQYSRFIDLRPYNIQTPKGMLEYPMYVDVCDFCDAYRAADNDLISDEIILTISEFNVILWKNYHTCTK